MSDNPKAKSKGPKAVIEMGPAEDELELAADAEAEAEGAEGPADGAGLPEEAGAAGSLGAAKATAGFLKRLGWRIWNYSEENPNTVFYTLVGLVFAILILTLGIWRALVIGVCMAVGAIYGQVRDGKNGVVNFFIDLIEGGSK